jgi:hypothetical protein
VADSAIRVQGGSGNRIQLVVNNVQSSLSDPMPETPSRDEIAARLEAAEARTETRITQLSAAMEARATATDHKIDVLVGKVDSLSMVLSTSVGEVKADNKITRNTIWGVGVGAVVAVLILVVALYAAGLNEQSNMIAIFQTGLGVRSLPTEAAKGPPTAPPPTPAPPDTPAKK